MSDWISVKDRLPDNTGVMDGSTDRVLVKIDAYYQPTLLIAFGDYSEDGFTWYFDGRPYDAGSKVTHWMPLPETPK